MEEWRIHFPRYPNVGLRAWSRWFSGQTRKGTIMQTIAGGSLLIHIITSLIPCLVILGTWMNSVNSRLQQGQLGIIVEALEANYGVIYEMGETKLLIRKQGE